MNKYFKKKNKPEEDEDTRGKYKEEISSPLVCTNDLHNGLVKVEIRIPDLEPGIDKFHPKQGRVSLDFFNKGCGFDMKAVLLDKTKMLKTTYNFRVKQLPGRIDTAESKWDVEKGKIVVMMEKHSDSRNIDWNVAVLSRGLDQESSSSSSDDDY